MSSIVHHHLIIMAKVGKKTEEISCPDIELFLSALVNKIDMKKIFEPIAINGKFGFTGVVGIVTSHITFHYFDSDQSLHFDIYSCKKFDIKSVIDFLDSFWDIKSADMIFIIRDRGPQIKKYKYNGKNLEKDFEGDVFKKNEDVVDYVD